MNEEQRKENWEGQERRSLPIHLLNYVDERLRDHADTWNGKLDAMQEEIYHLSKSISAWMEGNDRHRAECKTKVIETCEKLIDEAIPTSPDNPDATAQEKRKEHRKAHASWIDKVNKEMEEWRTIRQRIKEWAIVGAAGVVVIAVWQYLLQGPK